MFLTPVLSSIVVLATHGCNTADEMTEMTMMPAAGAPSTPVEGTESSASGGATADAPPSAGASGDWAPGRTCQKSTQCGGVACSTEMISDAANSPNVCVQACCTSEQKCGVSVLNPLSASTAAKCNELDQPGVASQECGSFGSVVGCCRPDNRCGLFIPTVGVGCAALDDIKDINPRFGAIDIPRASCHYMGDAQ